MERRRDRPTDRREQILRAAREVVMDGGFGDLQMNAVAAAAGIAVGTIYRYFPSRADLCAAIVSETSQREVDVLARIADDEGAAAEKIRDAVHTFAARAMRGRRLAYGLIFEPIDPTVESTRLRYRRAIAEVFRGIVEKGVRDGEFRELDPAIAATCIVGAFMEGLIGPLAPDERERGRPDLSEDLANSIADFCVSGVLKVP